MAGSRGFTLEVPLDASQIRDFKPDRKVKVGVQNTQGAIQAQTVEFDSKGKGVAKFAFEKEPGALRVAIGPADAKDEELFGLETLGVGISARQWTRPQLALSPIRIPPFYWYRWLLWCRNFTVRGRVVTPAGQPVPGAKVCAFDVDAWWWWSCRQLVGCDSTDASGSFEINFRWCCGWWPWWWWRMRSWQLEHSLLERIVPLLEREPRLRPIPKPDPVPDLRVFEQMIGGEQFAALNLNRHVLAKPTALLEREAKMAVKPQLAAEINPSVLADLRAPLMARLPKVAELEQLHLWPWWPWQPWHDCTPDLIFRVTQDCTSANTVLLDEGYCQARWNIPTNFDVTLVANDEACSLDVPQDEPEGTCALLTNVCDYPINIIGGNPGASPSPVGYVSPGLVSEYGDRPYGGNVLVQGQVGNAVDYYDFLYSSDGGHTWNDMPIAAVGGVQRQYWIPSTNTFAWVAFLTTLDGRPVFESLQHYENTHDPGTWGLTRFWMASRNPLLWWLTQTPFIEGTYRLRIRGWKLVDGHLSDPQILPTCSTETPAELVLRIDNRLTGAASGHPLSDPNHPCGEGTVHFCTREPDTDFLGVRIVRRDANGVPTGQVTALGACGTATIGEKDLLQVDFFAHDPDGHLGLYTLQATYRENLAQNLLTLPHTLTPLTGAPVPAAAQVGPSYANALSAHPPATAPTWHGGAMRLEMLARDAFPETCCYQLELRAHKRTVVNCDPTLWGHINYSEYSFMIAL